MPQRRKCVIALNTFASRRYEMVRGIIDEVAGLVSDNRRGKVHCLRFVKKHVVLKNGIEVECFTALESARILSQAKRLTTILVN
jgi:hypothetical protein